MQKNRHVDEPRKDNSSPRIYVSARSSGTGSQEKGGAHSLSEDMDYAAHILCVDDEEDILSVAKLSLETVGGYQVSTCNSGIEALERIADIKPDLILLDVMMPIMGGPATLLALREIKVAMAIPIVFMTARVQPSEVEEYLNLGASAVVHKPFDPMSLSDQIAEILSNIPVN